MSNNITENLERLLLSGKDGALLRFSLGSQYLKLKEPAAAIGHLQRAVAFDPDYSAAWKQLGRAFAEAGRPTEALEAYRQGIEAAQRKGDKQAEREMQVFALRLEKQNAPGTGTED
jgi:predicted Zn-dependent protease